MQGIITALIIIAFMFICTILKAHSIKIETICCKKSEVEKLLENLPEDCTLQILIGRNYDEHTKPYRP